LFCGVSVREGGGGSVKSDRGSTGFIFDGRGWT